MGAGDLGVLRRFAESMSLAQVPDRPVRPRGTGTREPRAATTETSTGVGAYFVTVIAKSSWASRSKNAARSVGPSISTQRKPSSVSSS